MALPLSGNFSETPFSDILTVLRLQKATGTLVCKDDGSEKAVYVKDGQIIFATSNDERERLGEILVKMGHLTRDQLEEGLRLHLKNPGMKKIGAVLVECGFVSAKDLFNGLKFQVRLTIQRLLMLQDGVYQFEEHLPPGIIPLQIDMEELLRDVIQQMKQQNEQ